MPRTRPRVLLIGPQSSWGVSVTSTLAELGCEVEFLTIAVSTSHANRLADFDLILAAIGSKNRLHKVPALTGSATSVFYVFPVEDGCWWLPALRNGVDCYGAGALRPTEFAAEKRSRCFAKGGRLAPFEGATK
jgi:hypothetical protein